MKWSTRDLAQRSGRASTNVNRIEAGQVPRPATEARILAAFAGTGVAILQGPEGVGAILALNL
ncbi:hypothetical protein [Phenylobacterium sp.]|uniref:hypothetical protein n=1 Tax=Phenylobacterium sp. TaxID=1871053 RepID=UPI0025CC1B09|nr:hypothetical protein [Phenylobacterium sp.]MCA6346854.1 hypothetical protein [Phenylobacterium sp.]MCA6351711.1 hypothetical protein [Phenylobacterium sp.]MCA6355305.1 hypothetical protein [Phenylobacterium sp.]MCA6358317.1 hypothetical protein [Phenylobacterium sp.]MCA6361194.1 hypothetical protein [Phenylobacterium sp.]